VNSDAPAYFGGYLIDNKTAVARGSGFGRAPAGAGPEQPPGELPARGRKQRHPVEIAKIAADDAE
jgi:hypothetical protein